MSVRLQTSKPAEIRENRSDARKARHLRGKPVIYGTSPFFTRKIKFPGEKSTETEKKP
jgi:hypothetical protein